MTLTDIEQICRRMNSALLDKYFGNLVHEAAIERPETIGKYTKDLPLKIEAEYRAFLQELWYRLLPEDKKDIPLVLDERKLRKLITDDDREMIDVAHEEATELTLWERITQSNHEDVTYYKGLLFHYTKDLLMVMRNDFLEEITGKLILGKNFKDVEICINILCGSEERQSCKDYMTPFCRYYYVGK